MDPAAVAFVPGHATALFTVDRRDSAERTGSRGAGVTITDGVTVRVTPGQREVSFDRGRVPGAVERVLETLGVDVDVEIATDLPVGAGFGVSGAAALGTALAASAAAGRPRSENAVVAAAHAADVRAGTGLGDVVAQARGGAPMRLEPGAPPHGALDGVPGCGRVEYLSLGGRSTPDVIGAETARLSAAGERALAALREEPTLGRLVDAGREFAQEAGLLTDDVAAVIEDVEAAGGRATMAMLGRSVIAPGTGLSEAGYDPIVCRVHPAGAVLRRVP